MILDGFLWRKGSTKAKVLGPTEVITWPRSCWSGASMEKAPGQGWFLGWIWAAAAAWWRPWAGHYKRAGCEHVGGLSPRFPQIMEGDSGGGWMLWSCGFLVGTDAKVTSSLYTKKKEKKILVSFQKKDASSRMHCHFSGRKMGSTF